MAKFIKLKGLKEGEVNFNPQIMEIPDKDIHRYEKCNWFKDWALLEEPEQTNVSIKNNVVEKENVKFTKKIFSETVPNEPTVTTLNSQSEIESIVVPTITDKTQFLKIEETQSGPKKRGRKPKKD